MWMPAWLKCQSNKLPCGGARHGGKGEASTEGSGSCWLRWVRGVVQGCTVYGPKDGIFSITTGSSMHAMILTAPPQARGAANKAVI